MEIILKYLMLSEILSMADGWHRKITSMLCTVLMINYVNISCVLPKPFKFCYHYEHKNIFLHMFLFIRIN